MNKLVKGRTVESARVARKCLKYFQAAAAVTVLLAVTSCGSSSSLKLVKGYIIGFGGNSQAEVYEFENSSGKPIDAFKGEIVQYDKFGKKSNAYELEYTKSVTGKQFYLVRMCYGDGRIDQKTESGKADMVKDFGPELKEFEKAEIGGKYEFRVKQVVLGK